MEQTKIILEKNEDNTLSLTAQGTVGEQLSLVAHFLKATSQNSNVPVSNLLADLVIYTARISEIERVEKKDEV